MHLHALANSPALEQLDALPDKHDLCGGPLVGTSDDIAAGFSCLTKRQKTAVVHVAPGVRVLFC